MKRITYDGLLLTTCGALLGYAVRHGMSSTGYASYIVFGLALIVIMSIIERLREDYVSPDLGAEETEFTFELQN